MSEIEKALAELKALMKYRTEQLGYTEDFRGLGLTSRKNLCLHPSVKREKSGSVVDARCRSLTAGFVKEKKERGEDVDVCVYHDVSALALFSSQADRGLESRSPRAPQSCSPWCLHPRRSASIWRATQAMPLLFRQADDVLLQCNNLFLPLFTGSENRRKSVQRAVERLHRGI